MKSEIGPVGPCITGIIDLRNPSQPLHEGFIIEEGNVPGFGGYTLSDIWMLMAALFGKHTTEDSKIEVKQFLAKLESLFLGPYKGAAYNTQTFLVMAHDSSNGQLLLHSDKLRINWPDIIKEPIFSKINETLLKATEPLKGVYSEVSFPEKTLISVHSLGGCSMAENADNGVVNDRGQVFCGNSGSEVYDSLYVNDAAVIPGSLGVNPSFTISAIAERCCALIAKDNLWVIDYRSRVAKKNSTKDIEDLV